MPFYGFYQSYLKYQIMTLNIVKHCGDGWHMCLREGWHSEPTNHRYTPNLRSPVFFRKMVRNPKRKTARASKPPDIVLRAIKEVKDEKISIRATATKYDIPFSSLARYCAKIPDEKLNVAEFDQVIGYKPNRMV